MLSPAAALTVLPSSTNSTAAFFSDAMSEILAEMQQQMVHRIGCGLAKATDRGVAHHRLEVAQPLLIESALFLQQRHHLAGSLTARRALATAFMPEELQEVDRRILGAVLVGEHHDGVAADERALLRKFAAEVERDVAHRCRQDATRRAARQIGLERMALGHAAATL